MIIIVIKIISKLKKLPRKFKEGGIIIRECHLEDNCRNYKKRCLQCVSQDQYKPFKQATGLSSGPSKKKKGMGFEEKVKKKYENAMAERMPQSGGFDFFEGDISVEEILKECKERGTVNRKGEKYISIEKKWLDKIEEEANMNDKLPALIFGYKDSDDIYFAMKYEYLLDLLIKINNLKRIVKELK